MRKANLIAKAIFAVADMAFSLILCRYMDKKNFFAEKWHKMTLRNKMMTFSVAIIVGILIMLLTDIMVGKIYLIDLRTNLAADDNVGNLVKAFESEQHVFSGYVRGEVDIESLALTCKESSEAILDLPMNFSDTGAERYAITQAISNAYNAYSEKRDLFLEMETGHEGYLTIQYEIYEMQNYLNTYAGELMKMTTEAGNEIYEQMLPRMVITPLILIVLSIVMIVGIYELIMTMNRSILEPLYKLSDASKKIAGNDFTGEDLVAENPDEIGDLIHAFNKMKFATSEYITALEERRETLELLHAEELQKISMENQLERTKFEVLRNQMNPHFLFNTLNVISGMANLEGADVTEKMIKALGSLFRYNLRNEETEIQIEQEIKVLEDYLYLQKMRFGARISWKIDYSPEISTYLVPTFMFQPFVENAIVHGISPKIEGGEISVSIEKKEERLHITVQDTGVGMTAEELSALREKLTDTNLSRRGIGMGNINKRLQLMYEDSSLTIDSEKDGGTIIRVDIPARE